jgi:Ca-activated chloride channel family protein
MSIIHQGFAYPLGLTLLALLPAMGILAFLAARRRRRILGHFGAPPKGLAPNWRMMPLLRTPCLIAAFVLLMVAIAGPQWGRDWGQSTATGRDLVVVLDLSRSMLANDVLPSRVERARQAVEQLSYAVQRRGGHRLALVAFAGRARLVCPLTHDYDHFRAALAELDASNLPADLEPRGPDAPSGTRLGAGIRAAVEAHDPRSRGYQDIILLSDGDDPARDEEWREGVEAAHGRGIPVHTVGVGNPVAGSPIPGHGGEPLRHHNQLILTRLEEQPLRLIAQGTGGVYIPGRTEALPLGELFRTRFESSATRDTPDDALPLYRQRSPWFLGSALLLLGLEMVLGSRQQEKGKRKKDTDPGTETPPRLFFLFPFSFFLLPLLLGAVSLSEAEEFIRQGNAAFARGDFATAVDFYRAAEDGVTDPGLVAFNEATGLYHLGHYREAELHYRYARADATGLRLARLLYNLGNCLLQQAQDRDARRLKEAVGCFELCLQQQAADEVLVADARHNLELARLLWLKAKSRKESGAERTGEQENDNELPRNEQDANIRSDPARTAMLDKRGKQGALAVAQPDPGATPTGTDQTPPPGKGNLPTLPDTDDLAPLSTEDAAEYLKQAATRILRERQDHLRQTVPTMPSSVKDW